MTAIINAVTATAIKKNRRRNGSDVNSRPAAMPARVTTRVTGDAIATKTTMAYTITTVDMVTTASMVTTVGMVTTVAMVTTVGMVTTVAMATRVAMVTT